MQLENARKKEWNNFLLFCDGCYSNGRFLELMRDRDMPIWAISTGNEPLNAVIGWIFVHFMSLGWTAESQVRSTVNCAIINLINQQ